MTLNYDLFKNLRNHVQVDLDNYNETAWYGYSYDFILNHNIDSIEDFWKFVCFAYSWMPTIPTIRFNRIEEMQDIVLDKLQKLRNGDRDVEWLFNTLTPVINNSVVGTSKTLHFIAPSTIPIYDSRVIHAWNKLFRQDLNLRLQYRKGGDIGKVLFYISKMHEWLTACKLENPELTLRDIELALYYYGKNDQII